MLVSDGGRLGIGQHRRHTELSCKVPSGPAFWAAAAFRAALPGWTSWKIGRRRPPGGGRLKACPTSCRTGVSPSARDARAWRRRRLTRKSRWRRWRRQVYLSAPPGARRISATCGILRVKPLTPSRRFDIRPVRLPVSSSGEPFPARPAGVFLGNNFTRRWPTSRRSARRQPPLEQWSRGGSASFISGIPKNSRFRGALRPPDRRRQAADRVYGNPPAL